jgi:alkylation response protein AidB-like acyl-CoA dehydrogenase
MLNFAPTEEQEEIRRLARSLALDELRPRGREAEKRGDIPPELERTLAQTGLTTPFPEGLGGSGPIEALTYALISEELGFGDSGLATNIIGSMMGPLAVMLVGNEDQQERYIAPFCANDGSNAHGSFAFAEHSGGYALADVTATARATGDGYTLSGTKRDVIHGSQSRPRVVLARLEGTSGSEGLCALVVPDALEGLQIRDDAQKLGLIAAPSASFWLEQAQVPGEGMLGQPGEYSVIRAATLYQILRAGIACGTARAALEYASDYAKERIAFGRPIVSYQGIAFMISEMAMKLDAARLFLWRAAASWDQQAKPETLVREAEAAQRQAVKLAKSATIDAVQIMGGAGFMQDHPVEMWMRNAAAMD